MDYAYQKISKSDFALLRGYLQGLDLRALADLYFVEGIDLRIAKSKLLQIVDAIQVVARRHGNRTAVRLAALRLPVLPAGPDPGKPSDLLPTLDEFRRARDPGHFYTERELIELYQEEFAGRIDRKLARNARLRDRQLEALRWAEQLVVANPAREDELSVWLTPKWARPLMQAGYMTLGGLADFINVRGYRWHEAIPRLGEGGAQYVMQWLQSNAELLEIVFTRTAVTPRRKFQHAELMQARPREVGVVPIESLICPQRLDGSQGTNRAEQTRNLTGANTDLAAIHRWLERYQGSPNTFRAYRKEAERLLLWAIFEREKPLSSISVEDCLAYRAFLAAPAPGYRWVGPRGVERWSHNWRPFEGALSPRSIESALRVCMTLFQWLTRMRYLDGNPFQGMPSKTAMSREEKRKLKRQRLREGVDKRSLPLALWDWVESRLSALPDGAVSVRQRFVVRFAKGTGLRASELVEAQVADLDVHRHQDSGESFVSLGVVGKGDKVRRVPVPVHVLDELSAHLQARGLPADPLANRPDTFLIGRVKLGADAPLAEREAGISYENVYRVVTGLFDELAVEAGEEGRSTQEQQMLKEASTHWLRHCFGSHSLAMGVGMAQLQQLLGHDSMETTAIYSTTELEELSRAVEGAAVRQRERNLGRGACSVIQRHKPAIQIRKLNHPPDAIER